MKYILYFLVFIFSHSLFGQATIKLSVKDIKDTVGYLGYHFADKRYVLDTVGVDDSNIVFTKPTAYKPGLYFFYTPSIYFEFIVNETGK